MNQLFLKLLVLIYLIEQLAESYCDGEFERLFEEHS